ncbi:hypothetical protein DK853_44145, partial [Klebsiella oxytoca]
KLRIKDTRMGDKSPPELMLYKILTIHTIATVRSGPIIIAVLRLIQIHLICATAFNLLILSILILLSHTG